VLLNYGLAVLSALLLVVVHPDPDIGLAAPFAVAPLVFALGREWIPRERFLLGYTTGVLFWAGVNYWIQFVLSVHGGLGGAGGTAVWILFCLIKGLYLGVFGLLAGVLVQRPHAVLSVPALWVTMEWMPQPFFYQWLLLGNAGIDMALPMRLAPVTGVYGLSFLFAMMGTAVALIALRRPRQQLWPLLIASVVLLLPSLPEPEVPKLSAVSIQPNIPERDDWSTGMVLDFHRRLEWLTIESALDRSQGGVRLVVWPEVPAPVYYFTDTALRDRVNNMARMLKVPVMIGTVAFTDRGEPLNAATLITPEGESLGRYDKIFPVPFGEYIPFPFKGLLGTIAAEAGEFVPGMEVKVFTLGDLEAGAFICYESAFPGLVRQFTGRGATVLVNLTNDGYFGRTAARAQHLSHARMRAAENARWLLRSTNDGTTASIDPAGRVIKTFPPFAEMTGRLPFDERSDLTLYVRYGDVFAWVCAGLAAIMLVISQLPVYRRDS
jgi:apolipoprotein N-acyltransferase